MKGKKRGRVEGVNGEGVHLCRRGGERKRDEGGESDEGVKQLGRDEGRGVEIE